MFIHEILKENEFANNKFDSFSDRASYDQIKRKLDCLQFLSTPKAFDRMVLTENDFSHKNSEETFEKISTMMRMNIMQSKKNEKKVTSSKLPSSCRNKNKIHQATLLKFGDQKRLKEIFEDSLKSFDNIKMNKFMEKAKAKTSLDILNFFELSSENGVSLGNIKQNIKIVNNVKGKKINEIKSGNNEKQINPEYPKRIVRDNKRRVSFVRTKNGSGDKLDKNIMLNRCRSSSCSNRITNFFTTSPFIVTSTSKNTKQNQNEKLRSKSNVIDYLSKKVLKQKNTNDMNLNHIMANIQTNEMQLLSETSIEELCKFSFGRQYLDHKEFENFFRVKKLEKESQKVIEPNYELIYKKRSEKLEPFIDSKLQKNLKNSFKINFKKITKKPFNKSQSVKNLFNKNHKDIDKNEISSMLDYCNDKTKKNTILLNENLSKHLTKNKLVEEVFSKLKGESNTPADEYIKKMTLENFKNKIKFTYLSSRGLNKKTLF